MESKILARTPEPEGVARSVYPRRTDPGAPNETDSFVYVDRYLAALGVRVPRIEAVDSSRGLVLLEDLGDTHLYDLIRERSLAPAGGDGGAAHEPEGVLRLYEPAIDLLIRMQSGSPGDFDPASTHNVPYTVPFILNYESGYFHHWMIERHCGLEVSFQELESEYRRIAQNALEGVDLVFMHRDFQSRNIMMTPEGPALIDLQGARLGPPGYDLASLVYDPYIDLPAESRGRLLERYRLRMGRIWTAGEVQAMRASAVNRTFQILGALAYLGGLLRKPGFLEHAPSAFRNLRELAGGEYPAVADLAAKAEGRL